MQICGECFQTNIACLKCGGNGVIPDASLLPVKIQRDVKLFASEAYPLHASAIPEMIKCGLRAATMHIFPGEYESSQAADTGSLTHLGVAEWHRSKDLVAAIEAMRGGESKFPQGSLAEATQMFYRYSQDPRNIEAEIARDEEGRLLLEYPLSCAIPPAESDPTQAPIYIVGTLDQVRVKNLRGNVWDLKTGKRPAVEQREAHVYQLACYALMATVKLQRPIGIGGLIMPRHYKDGDPATPGAYAEYAHRFTDILCFINGIRFAVAAIRRGQVHPASGPHCRYCPHGATETCVPLLRSIIGTNHHIRGIEQ